MDENVTKIKKAGALTKFKYKHIELSWTVEDWKLSKTLTSNKPLVSPVFEIDGFEWYIELITNCHRAQTDHGELSYEGQFAQIRLKLKAPDPPHQSPAPIVVDGYVIIDDVLELILSGTLGDQHALPASMSTQIVRHRYTRTNYGEQFQEATSAETSGVGLYYYIETTKEELPSSTGDNLNLVVNFKFSAGEPESHATETVSKTLRKASASDSPSQEDYLSEDFGTLLTNQKDCDMIIEVEDTAVTAHGLIFGARSSVVKEMLEDAANKGKPLKFKAECSSVGVWKEFQRFIYTGKTSIGDLELLMFADELFRLGKKFKVTAISRYLTTRLTLIMSHTNILDILEMAYRNDVLKLKKAGTKVLMHKLVAVKKIQPEKLVSFVQSHADIAEMIIQR